MRIRCIIRQRETGRIKDADIRTHGGKKPGSLFGGQTAVGPLSNGTVQHQDPGRMVNCLYTRADPGETCIKQLRNNIFQFSNHFFSPVVT
jgi:hypothetical protein